MATDTAGKDVFIEQAHFYVDVSSFRKERGCVQAETPLDVDDEAAARELPGAPQ
jgi:hypothetical protein